MSPLVKLLSVFSFLLLPFKTEAQSKHLLSNLSFTLPRNWIITGQTNTAEDTTITCEWKQHDHTIGIFITSLNEDNGDPEEIVRAILDDMDLDWLAPPIITDKQFGQFPGKVAFFSMEDDKKKMHGCVLCFKACGKTIVMAWSEESFEKRSEEKQFDDLIASFSCK